MLQQGPDHGLQVPLRLQTLLGQPVQWRVAVPIGLRGVGPVLEQPDHSVLAAKVRGVVDGRVKLLLLQDAVGVQQAHRVRRLLHEHPHRGHVPQTGRDVDRLQLVQPLVLFVACLPVHVSLRVQDPSHQGRSVVALLVSEEHGVVQEACLDKAVFVVQEVLQLLLQLALGHGVQRLQHLPALLRALLREGAAVLLGGAGGGGRALQHRRRGLSALEQREGVPFVALHARPEILHVLGRQRRTPLPGRASSAARLWLAHGLAI
mmetsp:Transcript_120362/g.335812  ORF Transcript_120362/g.335812 Transcript_120362/m.335812 type:complete len:262 (-) Transcript_120362:219-1004(-)